MNALMRENCSVKQSVDYYLFVDSVLSSLGVRHCTVPHMVSPLSRNYDFISQW